MKTIVLDGIKYQLTPVTTEAPKPVQWEPKRLREEEDGAYWTIYDTGKCFSSVDDFLRVDDLRASFGNYFHTKEEAEEAAKQVRQLLRLRAYVREFAPDWKADWSESKQAKCIVYFDNYRRKWKINRVYQSDVLCVYMPRSVAVKLADKLNRGEVVL